MKLGLRGKLVLATASVLVLAALIAGFFLERSLHDWFLSRTRQDLVAAARMGGELLALAPRADRIAVVDPLTDRAAAAESVRMTVIDAEGRVLGDSWLDAAAVAAVENHADRPEVRAALGGEIGAARRHSATVARDMLYVAVPWTHPSGQRGVVRAAVPLREIDEVTAGIRWLLAIAAVIMIAAAIVFIALATRALSRRLQTLVDHARQITRGAAAGRLKLPARDELARLAGSFNQLADELETTVETLAAERDRFQAVLLGMSDAVVAINRDRRVTLVNPAAKDLLGLDASPAGDRLNEVIDAPALHDLLDRAEEGVFGAAEFDLPGLPARRVLARITAQRKTPGMVLVLHDVTELRRLEQTRRTFVANVSHELRTPVSVIMANAETLLSGALDEPESATRFVEGIARNADRLSRIVADLLDIARVEAGQYEIRLAPVSVAAVVTHVVEGLRDSAARKGIALATDIEPDLAVRADAKALEQVLQNLVDNAVKYTPEGGRVLVRAAGRRRRARIEVVDTGPGIEPRHRTRIFERFYRVDPGRSRQVGGTGLGLSIVKHLVGAMNGRVGTEPASPSGSVFWVNLPGAGSGSDPPI